jgi:uncharacterized membrane protein
VTVRSRRRLALVAAALAFVLASAVIGRWLAADGDERAKVERLLEAQARGDADAMAAELDGCAGRCAEDLMGLAGRLEGEGEVEIVRYDSGTSHATGSETAPTRVVWRLGDGIPKVQCITVQRKGSVISGPRVTLLALSAPIGLEAAC